MAVIADRRLPPETVVALRAAAEALDGLPDGPASCVPAQVVRVFVWAKYRGVDMVEPVRALWFGADDSRPLLERVGIGCAKAWCAGLERRQMMAGVQIPRGAGRVSA